MVRIWLRIRSNNAVHYFLSTDSPCNYSIARASGLNRVPDRRFNVTSLGLVSSCLKSVTSNDVGR
jgi:hypothetical protein